LRGASIRPWNRRPARAELGERARGAGRRHADFQRLPGEQVEAGEHAADGLGFVKQPALDHHLAETVEDDQGRMVQMAMERVVRVTGDVRHRQFGGEGGGERGQVSAGSRPAQQEPQGREKS